MTVFGGGEGADGRSQRQDDWRRLLLLLLVMPS